MSWAASRLQLTLRVNRSSVGVRSQTLSRPSFMTSSWPKYKSSVAAAKLDFEDAERIFRPKSTFDLFLHWGIYKVCAINFVVRYCDTLYDMGLKIVGPRITHFFLRHSMFNHFCAGEDVEGIRPRIEWLQSHGIGGILDYAAEAKDEEIQHKPPASSPDVSSEEMYQHQAGVVSARVYDYQGEAKCDANLDIFLKSVEAVHNVTPNGFAAIKLTGLGNPVLLERLSTCIVEMTRLFWNLSRDSRIRRMALDGGKPVNQDFALGGSQFYNIERCFDMDFESFSTGWNRFFVVKNKEDLQQTFNNIDTDNDGVISYMEFMNSMKLSEIQTLVESCLEVGPLFKAALNKEELELYKNIITRVEKVMDRAQELDVRVMVDAEWTDIQPAIDHITLSLQRKYNRRDSPIVFATYQTYLKGMHESVRLDLARSKREGWRFGAKLVRGAYMVSERAKAEQRGLESPICDTYEATEKNFHTCADTILRHNTEHNHDKTNVPASVPAETGPGVTATAEMLLASHSRDSVEFTLDLMKEIGADKERVYFGQLMGMADHLTFTLGANGYKAYKYVPYGPIDEVVPYLIRRTQENSAVLGSPGVQEERRMVTQEMCRRIRPF